MCWETKEKRTEYMLYTQSECRCLKMLLMTHEVDASHWTRNYAKVQTTHSNSVKEPSVTGCIIFGPALNQETWYQMMSRSFIVSQLTYSHRNAMGTTWDVSSFFWLDRKRFLGLPKLTSSALTRFYLATRPKLLDHWSMPALLIYKLDRKPS